MKKIYLTIAMLCLVAGASAQITWNVKAGIGVSAFLFSDIDSNLGTKSKLVWRVGVGIETPLSQNWMFMPSIEFAQKGGKTTATDGVKGSSYYYNREDDIRLSYIQIPMLFAYRTPLSDDVNITFKAGPYVAYAVSGKENSDHTSGTTSNSTTIDLFKDTEYGKRFDAGLTLGVGFEYHRVELGIEAEQGFVNMFDSDNVKLKNSAVYVTLGYKF